MKECIPPPCGYPAKPQLDTRSIEEEEEGRGIHENGSVVAKMSWQAGCLVERKGGEGSAVVEAIDGSACVLAGPT